MMKHIGLIALGATIVVLLLLNTVAFTVSYDELALVKRFGETVRVIDGREQAGLKMKWPWPIESLVEYEARTFVFEDTSIEVATEDKQQVLLTMYCAWRIARPERFHESVGQVEQTVDILRERLRSAKMKVVGRFPLSRLVNTDPQAMQLGQIENRIASAVSQGVTDDYGIELVQVGIKRLELPEGISESVIAAQKRERQSEVERLQAAGEAEAAAIKARAEKARQQILAFADALARSIRAEGEEIAARQYEQFDENPELAMFLRSLESLKKELAGHTTLLLTGDLVPAARMFQQGADANIRLDAPLAGNVTRPGRPDRTSPAAGESAPDAAEATDTAEPASETPGGDQ